MYAGGGEGGCKGLKWGVELGSCRVELSCGGGVWSWAVAVWSWGVDMGSCRADLYSGLGVYAGWDLGVAV